MKKPIIHLYTLCWNEMDILPFVVDYWKKYVTKAVVYDNGSTDGSIEYLQSFDWIEVRHFVTEGMNDFKHMELKNSIWKESKGKADWVVVCDMDEFIYSPYLFSELQFMKEHEYNVMGMKWYCLCFDERPEHKDGVLLHTQGTKFFQQHINIQYPDLGKFLIFDPNKIDDMHYGIGCHTANPSLQMNLYRSDKVISIHIDKGLSEDYFIARRKKMGANLSKMNISRNCCFQYNYPEKKSRQEYRDNQSKAIDINEFDFLKI